MPAWKTSSGRTLLIVMSRAEQRIEAVLGSASSSELERLREAAPGFLSDAELSYFSTLQFARRQASYLLGRFSAKLALAQYLHEPDPKRIEIRRGVFEQPHVACFSNEAPGVSISHCDELAVALA